MQFIDTHIHLWSLDNKINEWVTNSNNNRLIRDYTLDDYLSTHKSAAGIITVEAADGASSLIEAKWIYEHTKSKLPNIKHITYIDMTQDSTQFEVELSKFKQYEFVIGFRDIMSFSKTSNYSPCSSDITTDKTKLENFAHNLVCLAQHNYIFNCQMYPYQLLRIKDIIKNSNVKCIIDHCGLPDFSNTENKNEWVTMLHEYNNVAKFKVSGLDINNNQNNMLEICQILFKIISIENLFIGSNFPVSPPKIMNDLIDIISKLLPKDDLYNVLINNANRFIN